MTGQARKPSGVERNVLAVGDWTGSLEAGPAPGIVTRMYERDAQHHNQQYVDVVIFGPYGAPARHLERIRYASSEAEALKLTGDPEVDQERGEDRSDEKAVPPIKTVVFPDYGVQPHGHLPDTL